MDSIKSLVSKTLTMPLTQLFLLLGLMGAAFIKSSGLAFLDAVVMTSYLTELGLTYLPFDYIMASFILSGVGAYGLIFIRRHGYGTVPVCALALLALSGLSLWMQSPDFYVLNLMFLFNVGAFGLFNAAFWSVAGRFIPIQLESRKFIAVLCADLMGFAVSGAVLSFGMQTILDAMISTLILMILFVASLKILTYLSPIPSETFVQKTGGAQDVAGLKLVRGLLGYAFLYMGAKGILLYALYESLIAHGSVLTTLGYLWGLFGGVGIAIMIILYRTRYLHIVVMGIMALCGSFLLAGTGVLIDSFGLLIASWVVLMISSYFYLSLFFTMLLKPLAIGQTKRIKWVRTVWVEPLGLLFSGVFLFYTDSAVAIGITLQLCGLLLTVLAVRLIYLYSDILLESFRRRQWRGGPLILSQRRVLSYIMEHLKSDKANDVIYFMRILGISKHPAFDKNLVKLLRHSSETVRLFALSRIERYQMGFFYKTIENVMQKDVSPAVQRYALSLIMCYDYDKGQRPDKYMRYLSDETLRGGVLRGCLKIGGDYALMAMDTLQSLAFSKVEKENIEALEIIEQAPLAGLVRLVDPLMKHPNPDVARQALLTAGAMRHPQLLGAVFDALDDTDLQETALVALQMYGKRAFPPLEKMLHSSFVPAYRQKILILFLDRLPSGEGKQILLRAMAADNQKLRKNIMEALINSGIVWIHKGKKVLLNKALQKDLERLHFELDFIRHHTQAPTHETEESLLFLRRALIEDVKDTRELILLQLQLLKPHPLFVKAITVLLGERTEQYETALGVIQDFLPHRLYRKIKPVALLPIENKEKAEEKVVLESSVVKAVSTLLLKPPFELPFWIKATALYCLRRLGSEDGKMAVTALLNDKNPIVLEAAIWALVRLEKDEAVLHETLLRVPTSCLAGQSLEKILES